MNLLGSIHKCIPPYLPITVTPLLSGQTTRSAFGISRNGQSIVFVNSSREVFLSTDYGANFQQKTNMLNGCNTISVSNNGQYILSSWAFKMEKGNMQLSTNSGTTWSSIWSDNNINIPTMRGFSSSISETGEYMFISGDGTGGGIYVSNNYGMGTWIRPTTNITTRQHQNMQGVSVSDSGQYVIVATNDREGIFYSNDYGVTFNQVRNDSTYGRTAEISGNGNYMMGTSVGPFAIWYLPDGPDNSKYGVASSTVVATLNNNIISDGLFVFNANGSECYFIDRRTTGATSRKLMVTTDNFQTATVTHNVISNIDLGSSIEASSNVKYILVWAGGLKLLTNTLIQSVGGI